MFKTVVKGLKQAVVTLSLGFPTGRRRRWGGRMANPLGCCLGNGQWGWDTGTEQGFRPLKQPRFYWRWLLHLLIFSGVCLEYYLYYLVLSLHPLSHQLLPKADCRPLASMKYWYKADVWFFYVLCFAYSICDSCKHRSTIFLEEHDFLLGNSFF